MRPEERALKFAIGAISKDERRAIEQQRLKDAALDAELSAAEQLLSPLALSKEAAPVPEDLWDGVESALEQEVGGHPMIKTELFDEGKWRRLKPKVEIKSLWAGSAHLVRCDAGAVITAHQHRAEERMVILSGTVHIGERVLTCGDTQMAPAGTKHEDITTPTGCVFLVQMMDKAA